MSTLQIGLLAAVLLLLLAWLALRGRAKATAGRPQSDHAADRVDTLAGWPPQPTRLMTATERRAFAMLTRALPDHIVLAQVPVSRFVSVPKRNSYADWLRRVGYQCVDLIVCDIATQVLAVVELQPVQPSERAKKRLLRIARTLKAAGVPLHVWREDKLPAFETLRQTLVPESVATLSPAGPPTVPGDPLPELTLEDPGDLPDRPATTWFDELDSEEGSLGKS